MYSLLNTNTILSLCSTLIMCYWFPSRGAAPCPSSSGWRPPSTPACLRRRRRCVPPCFPPRNSITFASSATSRSWSSSPPRHPLPAVPSLDACLLLLLCIIKADVGKFLSPVLVSSATMVDYDKWYVSFHMSHCSPWTCKFYAPPTDGNLSIIRKDLCNPKKVSKKKESAVVAVAFCPYWGSF